MNLKSITLQNFKGIENLNIELDGKTTVIFGTNGVGKSRKRKPVGRDRSGFD
mgnify:CR=1 FL=1